MKRKVNLTIDSLIIEKAKLFAKNSKQSLSSLVETGLRLTTEAENSDLKWIKNFHRKNLLTAKKNKEVNDADIENIKVGLLKKYL